MSRKVECPSASDIAHAPFDKSLWLSGLSTFLGVKVVSRLNTLIAIFCLCTCVPFLFSAEPAISRLAPPGFQSGTEVDWVIAGARLSDAKKLLFYSGGIEVLSLVSDGENKVKARVKVPATCPPGLHAFRMATATGMSNLRYVGVSPLPQQKEVEPNSDFAAPQALVIGNTVNGVIQNEDVDYYAIELGANQAITVELEGLRLNTEFFDPFVAILDENRFEMARSDDAPLLQQDCVCSMIAPKAGKYIIEVRESSFGGNDNCQYRLHVGDFPRPLAIIPGGGQPGETIQATLVDSTGRSWVEPIALPSESASDFAYNAKRNDQLAPSPNLLRVVRMPNALESEPDNDLAKLPAHELPIAFNGVLQEKGDVDWFKIKGKKDQQIEAVVWGRRILRSPVDSYLEIHKVGGGRLAAADDSGGPDAIQAFKIPADGEYLIAIRDHLNEGSPIHAYRIEVSAPTPSMQLDIADLQRYQAQTLEVPRGGRMAVMLSAQRKNFSSDLLLKLEDAPAGVEIVNSKISANQVQVPFMLRADADAPVDASLTAIRAHTIGNDLNIVGNIHQRTMLVRGQNNVDMWGHNANRASLAVCEECPFDIEVVQPEVPIVRNGAASLLVKAKRKGEFKEAIRLRLLYAPPGISASASIQIAADQTQAEIPLTANGNSAIGVFPITVLARANAAKGGERQIASEFINLEVADSFFDFKFTKSIAEIGKPTSIGVTLTIKRPPDGDTKIELVGLPAGVKAPQGPLAVSADATALVFPVEVAGDAKAGQFKTLVCKATISRPGGQIVQNQGTGELVLEPPPTKPALAVVPAPVTPAQPAAAVTKPLTRLEQLRQAKNATAQPAPSGKE